MRTVSATSPSDTHHHLETTISPYPGTSWSPTLYRSLTTSHIHRCKHTQHAYTTNMSKDSMHTDTCTLTHRQTHTHTHRYMHIHTHSHRHTHTHTHMDTYTDTHAHTHMDTHTHTTHTHTLTWTYTHMDGHTHTHTYTPLPTTHTHTHKLNKVTTKKKESQGTSHSLLSPRT